MNCSLQIRRFGKLYAIAVLSAFGILVAEFEHAWSMMAMTVTELEKDIKRIQKSLAHAKRAAKLERASAEALAEFRRTGQVPQGLRQEIDQTFKVKTVKAMFRNSLDDDYPALTFLKGAYEYAVIAEITGTALPTQQLWAVTILCPL